MPNHDPEIRRYRAQEEYGRYEDEQRQNNPRNYQGEGGQNAPRDQARYSQGGYQSDEYYGGWNQRNYGRAEGGDYARGSGGYGRQEPGGRYMQGDYGRSTEYEQGPYRRDDMTNQWEADRRGNYGQSEQGRPGTYAQQNEAQYRSQAQQNSNRWDGYGQSDYNRSENYGRGQGRGMQQSGMGGTYEGEFGPEAGSQPYRAGRQQWNDGDSWSRPGPMTGRGPEGYQRSDDRIKEDICERLTHHGQLDASKIRVQVQNCEVTLDGTVDSRRAKRMAEDAVDGIAGIKDVHNQLRVNQQQGNSMGTMGGESESLPKGKPTMEATESQAKGSGQNDQSASGNGMTTTQTNGRASSNEGTRNS